MIEIKDITKKYRSLVAVNHVNLMIQDGELFGLLGVNGAGKTTLISMLSTLVQPTSGTASLMGYDLIKEKEEIKKIMSVSPQETAIAPLLTVKENLSFFSEIYEMEDYTYLEEIEALCDRIAVIHKGNIIFEGKIEEMKEQTQKENIEDAFIALIEGDDPHETL